MCSNPETSNPPSSSSDGCMDTQNNTNSQAGAGAGAAAAGIDDGDTVSQQLKPTSELPSAPDSGLDGKYGPEHQHLQHDASSGEYVVPQTQPELVGHSIACAPYAYSDPYYGGVMTAYGAQNLVHPHLLGMHQVRLPLPLEMTEEPVYVNPKQYNGIMRRRQSRAKAELEKKLIKARKPYLHESRHQHAMRRQRGCGGRFLKTKQLNNGAKPAPEEGMGLAAAPSTESASPSGSAFTNLCTGKNDPSDVQEEIGGGLVGGNTSKQHTHSSKDANDNGCYQHHQDFRLSAYHSLASERGEEGDCSGQQRESILTRQTSHRTLTIQ